MLKLKVYGEKKAPIPKRNDFPVYAYTGESFHTPGQMWNNNGAQWCVRTGLYFSCFPVDYWMLTAFNTQEYVEQQDYYGTGDVSTVAIPKVTGAILIDSHLHITYGHCPALYDHHVLYPRIGPKQFRIADKIPIATVRIIERPPALELGFEKISKKPNL
jgi:hypothetical protein